MKKLNKHSVSRLSLLTLVFCLIACMAAVSVSAETAAPLADPSPAAYVAAKNADSVVGVLTFADEWTRQGGIQSTNISQGSGVVIRDGGYILTNNHVIEGGSSFQVLLSGGEKVDAELVGADSAMDLAVLKVDAEHASALAPVELGSSAELVVGSTAIAIGNPGGEVLANTTTQGIISALERSSVTAKGATRSISYIQHDAAINSGNSGGGLFNYKGQLIGINTLKYAGSAYSSITFEGLGFAIPVETAADVASDLIEYGKVIRPALGIQTAAYPGPDEPLPSYPPASLCVYEATKGGAAEAAGIKAYDFIYKVNGVRVTTMIELTGQLDQYEPGDTVQVTLIRYKNVTPVTQSMYSGFGGGASQNALTGEVIVSGGYEEITVDVVLEELK